VEVLVLAFSRRARTRQINRLVASLAFVPVIATACHFGGGGGGGERTVTVRVENNLLPASTLTISVLPTDGARRTVGVVSSSSTQEFRVPVGTSTEPHRLFAEPPNGPAFASRTFTLSTAGRVEWNVGQNALNVVPR
jgi:hypothetical protein